MMKLPIVAAITAANLLSPALPAAAAAAPRVTDTAGRAGYYLERTGSVMYRDIRAGFTITPQLEFLNGADGTDGEAGVQQCDPVTGFAVQSGVAWNGIRFVAVFGTGPLTAAIQGSDPCVTGGLITPWRFYPHISVELGDRVVFDQFYDRRHGTETLNCYDLTRHQHGSVTVKVGPGVKFREAWAGALDYNDPSVVVGGKVTAVRITARATAYSADKPSQKLTGRGDVEPMTAVSLAGTPDMEPGNLGKRGASFTLYTGLLSS